MATTTDLEKLVINYLTQDQYDDAREAGTLNANELYLTPDTGSTGGTVTSVAVANGGALSVSGSPITTSGTITISHDDTSSQSSVSNSGRTYIQSVTLDTYGHVTGLSSATETVTNSDEKLGTDAVTSGTTYYIVVGTNTTGQERKKYDASGIAYKATNGTANGTNGEALLTLGNSTASTSANWKAGKIFLYSSSAYGGTLVPEAVTSSSKTWTLPNKTGTIALTSDIPDVSGFITTDSDEKLKTVALTSGTTYYPILANGANAAANRQVDSTLAGLKYVSSAGTTSAVGTATLYLGNSTASGTANNEQGVLRVYGTTAYYHDIKGYTGYPASNRTIYLPRYTSTMYLTCTSTTNAVGGATTAPVYVDDTGRIQAVTSIPYSLLTGTPTIPSAYTLPVATYNSLGGVKPWKSYTGSASGPTAATASTAPTVNSISTNSGKYYAVEIDKDGHMFVNVPWTNVNSNYITTSMLDDLAGLDDLPTITLNGTETTSPNFYAPTTAGTAGYILKSNGSGAPTWTSATLTDENVKSTAIASAMTNYIVGSTTSTTTTGGLSKHDSAVLYTTANSDTGGYTQLRLGNGTATSSAGGKEGQIRLYGTNATYYITLRPGALTTPNKTITFPDATGTIALTSDLDGYLPLTGGDLSGNLRLNADSGVGRWITTRQNDVSVMSSGVSTTGIHGLYSEKGSRWMIQAPADGSSVTINEGDSSNTYIAGNLTISGDIFIGGTTSNYKVHGWVNASASSGDWYYRKFSDGTFDAWGAFTVTPTSSAASGNIYYSNAISVSLPFTVTEANITGSVGAQYAWIVNTSSASTTVSFRIARGTTISTSTALTVKLHVHGRY